MLVTLRPCVSATLPSAWVSGSATLGPRTSITCWYTTSDPETSCISISAATAALTWTVIEWVRYGKPTLVGIATGAIAGLATITPASGFVGPVGALVIGFAAGVLCFFAVNIVKSVVKVDDALDVMAVHGVGGATGVLLTAIFGATSLGGLGLSETTMLNQLYIQFVGVVATLVWSAVLTYIIVKVTSALVGLRVDEDEEIEGLDIITHGERGYDL